MIDGATGLFGSRVHVWAEGVEWCPGSRRGGSFLPSAAPSSSLFSCGGRGSAGIRHNTQVPTTDLRLASTWADFPSPLMFLQGWRSYLGMRKDEWTYLLKQKCPNKAQDHKSAIVNLGETKLPSTRIYLFCTNGELTPWKKKKKNVFIPSPLNGFWIKYTNFAIRNLSVLFLVAPELRNIGHSWITQQNCHDGQCQVVSPITDGEPL